MAASTLTHDISISNPNPSLNEVVTCIDTISNSGSTTEIFNVVFKSDGKSFYTSPAQTLSPGGKTVVSTSFKVLTTGEVEICAENVPQISQYGAIVFQDTTTTYAYDRYGNLISSGAISAGTDNVQIQAAINALAAGTVYVTYGTYKLAARVTVNNNISLMFEYDTVVKPSANTQMFYMKKGSRIAGCKIDVSGITYTAECIVIDGVEKIDAAQSHGVVISDILFYNSRYSGTAIYFKSTEPGASGNSYGFIYGVIVDNVRIARFVYGIRMHRTGVYAINWINGNKFQNIRAIGTQKVFYQETDTTVGSDLDGNVVDSLDYQSSGTVMTEPIIAIQGRYNAFSNIMIWDWANTVGSTYAIEFKPNSNLNHVDLIVGSVSYYKNNGAASNTCTLVNK